MVKLSYVRQEAGKYFVYSEDGKRLSKGYDSENKAKERLRQIEYFKKLKKTAAISLDIEKGDVLLGGRFKNSPLTVEEIGTDENGQPTVNGRKLLAFRIKKLMQEKTAEKFESKKEQKEERKSLPYRVRIEVVAVGPNDTVYGGVYDDGTFGLYGGGASDNDNGLGGYLKDGVREFLEETGYELRHAAMCDVEPVTEEWVELPKDASAKFKARFPEFRGSKTYFIRGDLPSEKSQDKAKGEDGKVPFKKVKLYPFEEALEMLTNLPKKCAAPSACKGRKAAIEEAKKMHNFSKEAGLGSISKWIRPIAKAGDAIGDVANGVDGISALSTTHKLYSAAKPAFDFAKTSFRGRMAPTPTGFKTKLGPVMNRGQRPMQAALGTVKDLFTGAF